MKKPNKSPIGFMFDCLLHEIKEDASGHTYITLKTHSKPKQDICGLFGSVLECAIQTQSSKRSRTANSYCWELCEQIAAASGVSVLDVYKDALRNAGKFKDAEFSESDIEKVTEEWTQFGLGWFVDKIDFGEKDNTVLLRFYYGTSVYKSKEMSRIIEFLVNEAEDMEITVLSERQRKSLIKKIDTNAS